MPDPPTIEPLEIFAGDLVEWTRSLADYPATDWTLTYAVRGASFHASMDVTASADGNDHAVFIAAADTLNWNPGAYWWHAEVTNGTEIYTVGDGSLTVKQKLETITSGTYDGRSFAKTMLDAIESILSNSATSADLDVVSKGIGDKNLTRDRVSLFKWRDKFRGEYLSEVAKEKAERGEGTGYRFFARPRRPS